MPTTYCITGIREALRPYYGGRAPGYYKIRAAMDRGMPFIIDPIYKKPRFVLEDVLSWIRSQEDGTNGIRIEARAKAS